MATRCHAKIHVARGFCVFGADDEFVRVMRTTLSGKAIGSRSVAVLTADDTSDMGSCHIIFFRFSERNRAPRALAALSGKSILRWARMRVFSVAAE